MSMAFRLSVLLFPVDYTGWAPVSHYGGSSGPWDNRNAIGFMEQQAARVRRNLCVFAEG